MISENELTRELSKAIQKAAIDGTLSESAARQFEDTLVENRSLTEDNNKCGDRIDELEAELSARVIRCDKAETCLQEWMGREQDLLSRESQAEVLSMSVEYEKKRVEDHKTMVGLVFRNTLLKKQVMSRNDSHTEATGACHNSYETKENLEESEE